MSFREKSSWVALIANLIVWGWYFTEILNAPSPEEARMFWKLVGVILATIVVHIAAISTIAILDPNEASGSLDERERAIERFASARAYEWLSFGLVVALGTSLYHWDIFIAVNAVLFAFILAEAIRYILEIRGYRRGLA